MFVKFFYEIINDCHLIRLDNTLKGEYVTLRCSCVTYYLYTMCILMRVCSVHPMVSRTGTSEFKLTVSYQSNTEIRTSVTVSYPEWVACCPICSTSVTVSYPEWVTCGTICSTSVTVSYPEWVACGPICSTSVTVSYPECVACCPICSTSVTVSYPEWVACGTICIIMSFILETR